MSTAMFPTFAHSNGTTAPKSPIAVTGSDYETRVFLLALAVLSEPLEIAARTLIGDSTARWSARTVSNALLFVTGSGLEMIFEDFAIDADPARFRDTFFSWCRYQSHHVHQPVEAVHAWHVGRPHSA